MVLKQEGRPGYCPEILPARLRHITEHDGRREYLYLLEVGPAMGCPRASPTGPEVAATSGIEDVICIEPAHGTQPKSVEDRDTLLTEDPTISLSWQVRAEGIARRISTCPQSQDGQANDLRLLPCLD